MHVWGAGEGTCWTCCVCRLIWAILSLMLVMASFTPCFSLRSAICRPSHIHPMHPAKIQDNTSNSQPRRNQICISNATSHSTDLLVVLVLDAAGHAVQLALQLRHTRRIPRTRLPDDVSAEESGGNFT